MLSTETAVITCVGRLFHRLMTLIVKLYLHKSYLGRYVHNFSGLPLVVLLTLRCKMLGKVGSYMPVKIL